MEILARTRQFLKMHAQRLNANRRRRRAGWTHNSVEVLEARTLLSMVHIESTFAENGTTRVPLELSDQWGTAVHLAAGNDGMLLALVREDNGQVIYAFSQDGAPNDAFGNAGRLVLHTDETGFWGATFAQQSDGKFVLAGGMRGKGAVARFLSDGSIDLSFGQGGLVELGASLPDGTTATGIALQADGKILAAWNLGADAKVFRLNADGSFDPSFGSGGMASHFMRLFSTVSVNVTVRDDGRIIVAGMDSNSNIEFALLKPDGSLDPSFGNQGIARDDNARGFLFSTTQQPDEKLLVVSGQGLSRFNKDGTRDSDFNQTGSLAFDYSTSGLVWSALGLPNGKILVGGTTRPQESPTASEPFHTTLVLQRFVEDAAAIVYRAYNPNARLHFLTTSQTEYQAVLAAGYETESAADAGFAVAAGGAAGSSPLHRLYDAHSGVHYYTFHDAERDELVSKGWRFEKDEGYIYKSAATGNAEVYHLYNTQTGSHFFTDSGTTRDEMLNTPGGIWVQHASLGFAVPSDATGGPANVPIGTLPVLETPFIPVPEPPGAIIIGVASNASATSALPATAAAVESARPATSATAVGAPRTAQPAIDPANLDDFWSGVRLGAFDNPLDQL